MGNADKAGVAYWDGVWDGSKLPAAINPHDSTLVNQINQEFHAYFKRVFEGLPTAEMSLLEIGCAKSAWLPYFAKEFGFEIWGLDYSELGCQQSEQILRNEETKGTIVLGDAFDPPENMKKHFDVVISFGVVEHFTDTSATLDAFTQFLKPGGILLTVIPNMTGRIGWLMKVLNRPVFDIHVPLDAEELKQAHQQANMTVIDVSYMIWMNLWVLNFQNSPLRKWQITLIRIIRAFLGRLFRGMEKRKLVSVNRQTSSYVFCVAKVS